MSLILHLSIHVILGVVAGLIAWLITKRFWASLIPGIIAGTLIDLDHVIDYLITFGWSFNFSNFIQGFQYLESAKMRVMFHGWEYVIILLTAYFWLKRKFTRPLAGTIRVVFLAVALGLFFHLGEDVLINKIPLKSYSIIYRALNNFEMEKVLTADHQEEFRIERADYLSNK